MILNIAHIQEIAIKLFIIRYSFSSFSMAESQPRVLQITAYK